MSPHHPDIRPAVSSAMKISGKFRREVITSNEKDNELTPPLGFRLSVTTARQ